MVSSYVIVGLVVFVISCVVQGEKNRDISVTFANCDEDSVIRFDKGFSMYVDGQYTARIRGCINADSFEDAMVMVKVKNYELAPWDICNAPDKKGPQYEIVKMLHDALNLNFECPFEAIQNCMDAIVDMRRYRRYLKLLPKFNSIKLNFQHDDERTSCIEVKTNTGDDESEK